MRMEAVPSLIPQDLISVEILPRLPVKSLLRFKSVCKNWKTLISDNPNFSNLHLEFQHENNKEHSLLYGFSIKDEPSQLGKNEIKSCPTVLGSSNGLLCFLDTIKGIYVLRNPATGTRRLIVAPPLVCSYNSEVLCQGFGYSPSRDDYKIVILCRLEKPPNLRVLDCSVHVYVFSTRTSEWRTEKIDPSSHGYSIIAQQCPKPSEAAVQLGEALHWGLCLCLSSTSIRVILAFDLTNDVIQLIPLPEPIRELTTRVLPTYLMKGTIFVSKIRNRLCVGVGLMRSDMMNTGDDYKTEVWMLERYGEPESWKMLFTLKDVGNNYDMIRSLVEIKDDSGRVLVPLSDRKRYKFVVIDSPRPPPLGGLVQETESRVNQTQFTIWPKHKPSGPIRAIQYIETLVSPFPHD